MDMQQQPQQPEQPQEPQAAAPDTITIETPGKHSVVLKSFISGGDMEDMEREVASNIKFKVNTGTMDRAVPEDQEIPADVFYNRLQKAIQILVLSVDGKSDDVYQLVRALPLADYDAVIAKVNEISAPLAQPPQSG